MRLHNWLSCKLPLRKALLWIFFFTLGLSGFSAAGLLYYRSFKDHRKMDPAYHIVALVQTSQEPEGLPTVYLAELLNLSIDQPTNLYSFDAKQAQKLLLEFPPIKEAAVRKIKPGTIHVDYLLRKPIAFIGDYTNAVIDREKILFPFKPFFRPKNLPEIILGSDEGEQGEPLTWGDHLQGQRIDLALSMLKIAKICGDECSVLTRVDVSQAFALSYGQRQIVLIFEEKIPRKEEDHALPLSLSHLLRLAPENVPQQLANYLVLRDHWRQQGPPSTSLLIDLRLPGLAFFKPNISE